MEDFLTSTPAFQQADQFYDAAMEEYARPEEDVVPFMVCESAYKAIINYMKGYIQSNGRTPYLNDSPEMLLEECRIINPVFHELNIDIFRQKEKNDDVLMNMNIVNHYMNLLRLTRRLVGVA